MIDVGAPLRKPELIVEVAHPSINVEYGVEFLKTADFMVHVILNVPQAPHKV